MPTAPAPAAAGPAEAVPPGAPVPAASVSGPSSAAPHVRLACPADAAAVIAIRSEAIRSSAALWIDTLPSPEEAQAWAAGHAERGSMLVAELPAIEGGTAEVVGFASHAPLRPYDGYRWTAEDSIYLLDRAQGHGLGSELLEALIPLAAEAGMRSLIGMIEASNAASIALHTRCGFTEVGRIPQAGRKFERWLDLVIMQRLLRGPGAARSTETRPPHGMRDGRAALTGSELVPIRTEPALETGTALPTDP